MTLEEELKRQVEELRHQLDQLGAQSSSATAPPTVNSVSCKLSAFWHDKPVTWFAQAEAQFEVAGITRDATKYGHVLSVLSSAQADEIEDVLINPPAENKYENLKTELIKRFSVTREQRIRQLLSDEQIGDRKPSSFLRHLRSLSGKGDDSIVRELWMRRLPDEVQRILMAQADLPLDKVADLADAIVDAVPSRPAQTVSAASTSSPDLAGVIRMIAELAKKVDSLAKERSRPPSRSSNSRTRSSSRSSTNNNNNNDSKTCWYHRRFGMKANRCIHPCGWKSDAENAASNQ